jgi:transcriptional regulator with XRE-family HTH domain
MNTNAKGDGGELRMRRRMAGLSQQALAERAHCSMSYVALLEKGFTPISSLVLERIVAVLDGGPPTEGGPIGASDV